MIAQIRDKPAALIGKLLLLSLFSVFFILHGYNENFGLIPIAVLLRLFLYYIIITILLFIISLFLFRDRRKAFVFSFLLLCIFFFFGFFYDKLKLIFGNHFLSSYTFILPFILFFISLLFFFIKLKVKDTSSISRYITWLLYAFVSIELTLLGYNTVTNKASKNDLSVQIHDPVLKKNEICTTRKPDIFFIVFDEYTSSKGLLKYFNFNNYPVDSLFRSAGFYISTGSKSNYNMTVFSLASTFNYNYLSLAKSDSILSHNSFLKASETLKKNRLISFLSHQGYDIINYGCFDIENALLHTKPYFEDLPQAMIDKQTFISRFRTDIGWNFAIKNIFTGRFKIPESYKRDKKHHLYRNKFNAENALKELTRSGDKPRFIYIHLMLPHDPFFLDSAGNLVSDTAILQESLNSNKAYIDQLIYSNGILKKMIKVALTKTSRERVVIIEGDHGHGLHDNPEFKDREFSNLNAYYFSDLNYNSLYPSISPVNTFRAVLNKYFCNDLPLLKDSSFYIRIKKF